MLLSRVKLVSNILASLNFVSGYLIAYAQGSLKMGEMVFQAAFYIHPKAA